MDVHGYTTILDLAIDRNSAKRSERRMTKARYIMVGGFLGAGKTTALVRLAEKLQREGRSIGLITNDQSVGLVDTAMLAAHDLPVEEITGGCFCCRFNSLTEAAEKLSQQDRPDVFLAEPVGSCTDLVATVSYPLRRIYDDAYSIAPYSVLVDPIRAERTLGLATGNSFSPRVLYIYNKQLEEAEVIVVNKTDLLNPARLEGLTAALMQRFPKAQVVSMSARSGVNFEHWTDLIATADMTSGEAMAVDYDIYAEGEALLGWVNCTAAVRCENAFDGNEYLLALVVNLHKRLVEAGFEVAHLKATLSPNEGNDLAVANVVRGDGVAEASHFLRNTLRSGELIVNLRAEADPAHLHQAVLQALEELHTSVGVSAQVAHLEAFRPGRPIPTHRLAQG